jgi:hypothetical protein
MDSHIRRFGLKYRVKKINCSVVHQCALFIDYLKRNEIQANMIRGFCVCAQAACRHFWVEVGSQKIDIARELSLFHTPELKYIPTILQSTIDESMKRMDIEDPKIIEEHERLFDLWEKDLKQFWKETHRGIKI